MTWARVLTKDIRKGDRIARSRKDAPALVVATKTNLESRWLTLQPDDPENRPRLLESASGYRIRPGMNVKFWKVVED